MELLIQKIISSVIQIIVFAFVPFIWWLITAHKKCNFFAWIGIKKVRNAKENRTLIWTVCVSLAFLALSVFMLFSVKGLETATSEFAGLGVKALPAMIVFVISSLAAAFLLALIVRGEGIKVVAVFLSAFAVALYIQNAALNRKMILDGTEYPQASAYGIRGFLNYSVWFLVCFGAVFACNIVNNS